jgi:hypothetical protein
MKNMSILVILVALAVVLSGCGTSNTGTNTAFIGGNTGLKVDFLPGNPPDAIYDANQSAFSIVTKLENVGETTVAAGDAYVRINGLDPGAYGWNGPFQKSTEEDILGARKNFDGSVLNGGVSTVEFGGLSYHTTIQGNLEQTIWADVCYKYTTKTTTQLCIKSNPQLLIGDQKICDVEGEKNPQNSGAPIQVTSLKESFAGTGKIGVSMVITHTGTGDAFFDPDAAVCNDIESEPTRGKVYVKVLPVTLGGANIMPRCTGMSGTGGQSNQGYVHLYKDGSGKEQFTLYCTIDASSTDSIFQVPIEANITYKYLEHLEKTITIRHVTQ